MSAPTGDPRVVAELNELLGRELGRNEYGKPYFTWRWSEDLTWPAFATGRTLLNETKVRTHIFGAPADTHDYEEAYDAASAKVWAGMSESDIAREGYKGRLPPAPPVSKKGKGKQKLFPKPSEADMQALRKK